MFPLLKAGDEVLVDARAYRKKRPDAGDLVLVLHPQRPGFPMIKRITAVLDDDRYFLRGDNVDESTDSRDFGAVAGKQIIGNVTCRFP